MLWLVFRLCGAQTQAVTVEQFLSLDNWIALGMLTLLQAVLGFDNLLYISLESKRAPVDKQAMVRKLGIGLAVGLRIVLLLTLMKMIQYFQNPLFNLQFPGKVEGSFNLHSIIVLIGGGFIIYTSMKEIMHMMELEESHERERSRNSTAAVITWIVLMNLVFSFDSILSAIALSNVFWVMALAIIIGGILMIWLADRVALFLQRNRMFEVMGLFILFVVGIMLVTEGGHLAHLKLAGKAISPMTKTTFYFVIGVLVISDIVQSRYRKRLTRDKLRPLQEPKIVG